MVVTDPLHRSAHNVNLRVRTASYYSVEEGGKTIKADPKASLEYFSTADAATKGNGMDGARKRARVD